MEYAVYDTYVTKKDGKLYILMSLLTQKYNMKKAIEYEKQYLESCSG
jgi:hypothetical protein